MIIILQIQTILIQTLTPNNSPVPVQRSPPSAADQDPLSAAAPLPSSAPGYSPPHPFLLIMIITWCRVTIWQRARTISSFSPSNVPPRPLHNSFQINYPPIYSQHQTAAKSKSSFSLAGKGEDIVQTLTMMADQRLYKFFHICPIFFHICSSFM